METPQNDEMRGLQRDALVAYILHQMRSNPVSEHIDTPEKLFEYFLMDVQMDPCMQTSRIRHALSSVQLFIERCLMNLEPRVTPSSINAKQWEWMKRYRVWEANRKVFLYPENWLEPELRDDQSPFFKEAMSELLQGDITEDRAAVALLNYLSKLEEVAKLEPCGIQYVENAPGTADDIAHVVARTAGANRKYYYRRREYGYWTPWEQIKLDIEDNPVIPVVWKGRLFLFWLRILKQTPDAAMQAPTGADDKELKAGMKISEVMNTKTMQVSVRAVLCWSEYYNGKWQPTKTSDANKPTRLGEFNPAGIGAFDRSGLFLAASKMDDALQMIIRYRSGESYFHLYNTHSLPVRKEDPRVPNLAPIDLRRNPDLSSDRFTINYTDALKNRLSRHVLINPIGDNAVVPRHVLQNPWEAPFFYEDSRHVFYVTTEEQLIPVWNGYVVSAYTPKPQFDIAPLVFEAAEIIPDKIGPVISGRQLGIVDPSPIERFVSEDAYISRGIASTGTVRFGDKEIGLAGSLMNGMRRQ
jgi:hypothetical protein